MNSQVMTMRDQLHCTIPGKAEYIGIPRLMITGLAAPLNLDIETLEDLKLIVTESCNLSFHFGNEEISVDATVEEGLLTVTVSGVDEEEVKKDDMLLLSSQIIRSLADDVDYKEGDIVVRKKY